MTEVTHARKGELLRGLFQVLMPYPEGMKASRALGELAKVLPLTSFEAGMYESGRRFEKIVRFTTVKCVKAGWLVKHKGVWVVSEEGQKAYAAYPTPEQFYREATKRYRVWDKGRQQVPLTQSQEDSAEMEDAEQSTSITFEQAEEQAWSEIERFLKGMDPFEFQRLVADLLRGMGYFVSWIAPPGKDGGVDIIAHPDPLGTQSPRIKAQVKRYSEARIARPEVQSFLSTIGDNDAGMFVCTSGFTKDAEEFARNQERRKLMLIDLERFFDLWVQFQHKLDDTARRRFPITPIYFLTPEA
jgi:restriction system protein